MSQTLSHATQVRALYKAMLKLHRGLPYSLQAMGDQYVKDEFRRHKECSPKEAEIFMKEWTKYYLVLAKQLSTKRKKQTVGVSLSAELLENFNDEQIAQLNELFNEATIRSLPEESDKS